MTNKHVKLSIDTCCDPYILEIVDRYLPIVWPLGMWNSRSIFIALTSRYKALHSSLFNTPVGLSTSWCFEYRYLLSPVRGRWSCRWIPISLPNRSRRIGMIDTFEKKGVRRVSVVQRQQLSIEILTNLLIKTSTLYYRKSAVLKQKARSRCRHILLSSKVFIQTIG